jgi:hypothetical protein
VKDRIVVNKKRVGVKEGGGENQQRRQHRFIKQAEKKEPKSKDATYSKESVRLPRAPLTANLLRPPTRVAQFSAPLFLRTRKETGE